ncbi:hypothetical protein AB0I28_31245 [Phytomonospora sp. NPDC050363]|uniref:DUF7144 family membrane protein n=1 Tax=Phytomonospora sp. NPDC050363 TaxID=3155642 RepID=UPI0033FA6F9F
MSSKAWSVGGAYFGAWMLTVAGIWQALLGIAAIAGGEFFGAKTGYLWAMDTTTWGWIHLIIGVVAFVAGCFVFTGAAWARAVGAVLAALSATAQFLWLPHQPFWALIIIALDVFVIWALVTMTDIAPDEAAERTAGRPRRGAAHRHAASPPS